MSPAEAKTKGQKQQAMRRVAAHDEDANKTRKTKELWHIEDEELKVFFHPGQMEVWNAQERIVVMIAGSQSGKTSLGPLWLFRELQNRGPGDYLCVSPNYTLYKLKMLPEFLKLYQHALHLGVWRAVDKTFYHNLEEGQLERTRTIFGSAENPESLESATAKAAWLDEAGQNQFRIGSWEAVLRRLAYHQGRILITTTPYNLGWVKGLYDRANDGDKTIRIIQFPSTLNPNFPPEEFARAQATMPSWRFKMFYMGQFERPAGTIYDVFDSSYHEQGGHKVHPFEIPRDWSHIVGIDFGGANTAKLYFATDPSSMITYCYRETKRSSTTINEHAQEIKEETEGKNLTAVYGGSKSEGQWREDFADAGLYVREPEVADVEVGIQRAYGLLKTGSLKVFDSCTGFIDELSTYSRKLDENNQPTEQIDHKERFHFNDAFRYAAAGIEMSEINWASGSDQEIPHHTLSDLASLAGAETNKRLFSGPSNDRAALIRQASWSQAKAGPPSYTHKKCGYSTITDQALRAAMMSKTPPKVLFCGGCQDNFFVAEYNLKKES